MYSKMKRLLSSSLLACLLAAFALGGTAFAASTPSATSPSSAPPNLAALQKTCAVLEIHLNGMQHTVSCLSAQQPTNQFVPHGFDTYSDPGCHGVINMIVWYNGWGKHICFDGWGYLGLGDPGGPGDLSNVNEVQNWSSQNEWIRYYNPGGVYCTITPDTPYTLFGDVGVFLTQVDIGDSNGSQCPY